MKPVIMRKKSVPLLYGLGIAQIIVGIPVVLISCIVMVVGLINFRDSGGLYYVLQLFMIPLCTGGALLLANGIKICRFTQNFRRVSTLMEFKNREKVQRLAQATGQTLTAAVRDLRQMSDRGFFPQSHVDLDRCEFVLSAGDIPAPALSDGDVTLKESERPPAFPLLAFPYAFLCYFIVKPYTSLFDFIAAGAAGTVICALLYRTMPKVRGITEKKYKALPPPSPVEIDTGNDALDDLLNAAVGYVSELNSLSLSITSAEMTEPVKELLDLSRQIFAFVDRHPEKARQIRQFMNYYLPTTIKLLKGYKELSHEAHKSGDVLEALSKIENSMDEVVGTFKRELDNLYRDKAEDIGIDVDVMLTMMRQHGIGEEFAEKDH